MDLMKFKKRTGWLLLGMLGLIGVWLSSKIPMIQLSGDSLIFLSGLLILGTWYLEGIIKDVFGISTDESDETPPIIEALDTNAMPPFGEPIMESVSDIESEIEALKEEE